MLQSLCFTEKLGTFGLHVVKTLSVVEYYHSNRTSCKGGNVCALFLSV